MYYISCTSDRCCSTARMRRTKWEAMQCECFLCLSECLEGPVGVTVIGVERRRRRWLEEEEEGKHSCVGSGDFSQQPHTNRGSCRFMYNRPRSLAEGVPNPHMAVRVCKSPPTPTYLSGDLQLLAIKTLVGPIFAPNLSPFSHQPARRRLAHVAIGVPPAVTCPIMQ